MTSEITSGSYEAKSCCEPVAKGMLATLASVAGLVVLVALAALFIPSVAFFVSFSLVAVQLTLGASLVVCLIASMGALLLGCKRDEPNVDLRSQGLIQEPPQVPLVTQFDSESFALCHIGPHQYYHLKPKLYNSCYLKDVYDEISTTIRATRSTLVVGLGVYTWESKEYKFMRVPIKESMQENETKRVLQSAYEVAEFMKNGKAVFLASGNNNLYTNVFFMFLVEAFCLIDEIKDLPEQEQFNTLKFLLSQIKKATLVDVKIDLTKWCTRIKNFNAS